MNAVETDRQQAVARELGVSYREMTQIYAWKDLDALMTKIVQDSNHEVDLAAIEHLNVAMVARARGLREAVDKIRKHVDYAMNGGLR